MRYFLLLTLVFVAPLAAAQRSPAGERVWGAWQSQAASQLDAAGTFAYRESATRQVDSPRHGGRTIETEAEVRVLPGRRIERRLVRARVDGREVNLESYEGFSQRLRRSHGPAADHLAPGAPIRLVRTLASMQAVGRARAVEIGGRRAWEVHLAPTAGAAPEGAIVWLTRDGRTPQLLRADITFRPDRGGSVQSLTDFRRHARLDLPYRQRIEAVLPQQRRIRTFTTIVEIDVTYDRYVFEQR